MAMELPLPPFQLEYQGGDADKHTADAVYIGQSIQGTARLYNSIVAWHFQGKVLLTSSLQDIRVHVGPVKEGSLFYLVYLMMVHGKLALYPQLFSEMAKLLIPPMIKALIARRSGQNQIVEKQVDAMLEMYRRHDDFARQVHRDHVKTEGKLLRLIDQLVETNKRPLSDMAAPIGRTVKQIEHFKNLPEPIIVDEPTAEALRAPEGAVVGDLETYFGTLKAVDTTTGSCKFLIDDAEKPIRCKITDPALSLPENVYTHALDTQRHITITAKPVSKNGKVSTLYVSDAKPN